MAAGPARRRVHPAPGPHVARLPRTGAGARRACPYRAETSSLVYSSREVRDLLMTLRAVDDSSNSLALVAALRSSVFGCGDDDLFRYKVEHGGHWNIAGALPEDLPADDPVGEAMRLLRELHVARMWSTPSELLERIVRERAVLEVGALTGRFRDVARRVRFLIDQARAYADAVGGTLRDYLAWAEMQGAEGARVVEAVVPETDDDAVRIMTIHGAKGLEFPIVVCSGMTTWRRRRGRAWRCCSRRYGRLRGQDREGRADRGVRAAQAGRRADGVPREAAAALCRVHAGTRPSRRLGAPEGAHAAPRRSPALDARRAALGRGHATRSGPRRTSARARSDPPPGSPGPAAEPGLAPEEWQEEYDRAHRRGNRRGFVSATTLAHRLDPFAAGAGAVDDPGLAKEGRDLELPPWNKGRYGTAIGRAVHATLQTIDLTTGAGIEPAAAAQAAAEGVLGYESTIADVDPRHARERGRDARRGASALARDVCGGAVRGHHARGIRRSRVPRRRRARRRRLQDRRGRRADARRSHRALPDSGRRVHAGRRRGHG